MSIVCLGIHIVDILGRHVSRIPTGQNVDILDEIRITVAGTAAGTAIDLSKLGANVIAMGAVGSDELGNFIIDTMTKYGIDATNLVRKTGVQTSATILPIRPTGERPALHVPGANHRLVYDDLNLDVIKNAAHLHLGGTGLMSDFDGQASLDVLKYAKENGVVTSFDLVAIPRPDLLDLVEPLLPFIDYFMPGLEEARMIAGLDEDSTSSTSEVIDFFLARGVGTVVFTNGEKGSIVANKEIGEVCIPAFEATKIVDSTGCGDSFCAGFIVGLSMGWSLEECCKMGSACGALVITGLGSDAGIFDLESTVNFMKSAKILDVE
mmetsp:Transcript_623/g.834  ORF Transcript_623/g.834 Transcript_623/m.834 type:complete len:322 (-) Transcript_623:45-1010(-)|eukprot:CAMPEP_0172511728 /NCGR_PEP_ID=MMETSP1066-20121228/238516_1 /TAXON_ID=671091 /ORGANISM="Coscinodiscus wailesii, Strain CCMP2513" /LENGTH=321 /DNA_ID=CAMNT_0013291235 /DNA_START=56 /DNA_END=1024 /DNA_ORIENTATION=+